MSLAQSGQILVTRFAFHRVFPLLHFAFDKLLPSPAAKQVQPHEYEYPRARICSNLDSPSPSMGLFAHDSNRVIHTAWCGRHDVRCGHYQAQGRVILSTHLQFSDLGQAPGI